MKKQLLYWSFAILFSTVCSSQNSFPPGCGGFFTDNGADLDYLLNSNEITTICPENPGDAVTVMFETFSTEAQFDGLYVFNGNSINSPQYSSINGPAFVPGSLPGAFWGDAIPGPFTSTSPDGCLTFHFRSDAFQTSSGWIANVTCGTSYCLPPTDIMVSELTPNSAILNWTAAGGTSQWMVEIIPPVWAPTIVSETPQIALEGLSSNQSYIVTIKTLCPDATESGPSNPLTFQTLIPSTVAIGIDTELYSNQELISQVLIANPCLQVSNLTSKTGTDFNNPNGIGFFTNTNPGFPLSSGIVLSTGDVHAIPGPNTNTISGGNDTWVGDSDLEQIIDAVVGTPMDSRNASSLEFDFVALNEFMSFNFLFASEEYGLYQCDYADAFAFLLTDLETGITTNLAVVPGTTDPVSVVTIRNFDHNQNCESVNEGYFGGFNPVPDYESASNFNGITTVMTASSPLIANRPYHIKLVIADRTDSAFDSAVFIEAGSFTLGPPQCTDKLELVAFEDVNQNGIKDESETAFTRGSFVVERNDSGETFSVYSPVGNYALFNENPSDSYDITYDIQAEFVDFYACTTAFDNLAIVSGNGIQTVFFPVILTQPFNDVAVMIVPIEQPRPGLNYQNKIVYTNTGVVPASGTLEFYKDTITAIVAVSQPGINATSDGFTYNFTDLQPNETRNIWVTMSVPAPPVVNLDDLLTTTVNVTVPLGENSLENNSFSNPQVVVNSYDPNMVIESHGEMIDINTFTANEFLYYTIYFQNTGTASAIKVVIDDLLDSKLEQTSVVMLNSSHIYSIVRQQSQLKWTFDYIMLPGQLEDEALSKGYVFFKVRVKPDFEAGDIIPNTAQIFFDSNLPITTNTFNTIFYDSLGTPGYEDTEIVVYPNPARTFFTVQLANETDALSSVVLYDMVGKQVLTTDGALQRRSDVSISSMSKGLYIVEIMTRNNNRIIRKLVID